MLTVFEVSAYHFYKLIEVAIKVEVNFPRSIIKHLNRVSHTSHDDHMMIMLYAPAVVTCMFSH